MENKTIKQYCEESHENAVEKGFYDCPECNGIGEYGPCDSTVDCLACGGSGKNKNVNIGEKLMLIVSELGEAMEAHRKNKFADWETFVQDKDFDCFFDFQENDNKIDFELLIKDTFEDEIADTFIRLFDLCGYLNIDIEKFIQAKMAYNKTRPHKHGKEY